MKEVFQNYIENAFCTYEQSAVKRKLFEMNYNRFFPKDKESFLLDIGVGTGEMLSYMKSAGYNNYIGIDISDETIKYCTNLGLKADLVDDTPEWLLNNKGKFDLITLLDVLEHIKKPELLHFLKSIHDALSSNGVLIVQAPNLQSPDGQLHRYNDITHEIGFTEHSLNQILIVAGYKNVDIYGFEDNIPGTLKHGCRYVARTLYWKYVRFTRLISGNLNPEILNPVFFAVARKNHPIQLNAPK